MTYGEDNVIEVRLVKEGSYLHMAQTGFGTEHDNLDEPDADDIRRSEAEDGIARRLREGETYRSIARDMRVSVKTVAKVKSTISDE